jgi:AcrR family transcriptional regulator
LLTRERILEAALRLVDEGGVEALSMRRLAAALGVDPMAIYHHLPGRAAVIAGLVERVFGELRIPPGGAGDTGRPWQERVRAFARAYRALWRAHPHLALHAIAEPASATAGTLAAGEELYAALAAAGLSPRLVVRGAGVIVDYIHGFALAERAGALDAAAGQRELQAQLAARPPGDLPTLRRILAALGGEDGGTGEEASGADFEFGLDVLLAGLASHGDAAD